MPDPLALDDLFPPAEMAEPAAPSETAAPGSPEMVVQGGEISRDSGRDGQSRVPLVAGFAVTLAVLAFGGGFLWWRNRDSQYWPA